MATHGKESIFTFSNRSQGVSGVLSLALAVVLASTIALGLPGCDSKTAWTDTGAKQLTMNVECFAYDSVHDVLYAGTKGQGLWRCTGASTSPHWFYAGDPRADTVGALAYDPTRDILYASGSSKATKKSKATGGVFRIASPRVKPAWVDTHAVVGAWALAYDPSQNALYSGGGGAWRCTKPDSAPRWSDAGGELNSVGIGALIYDGATHTLFAGTSGVLWASTLDANLHWHNITTTLNSPEDFNGSSADSLAYDSKRNVLYVGTPGIGVRRCVQPRGARVWTSIGDSLIAKQGPNAQSALGLDTARDILYVGGYEAGGTLGPNPAGGVWRCTTPDANPAWSPLVVKCRLLTKLLHACRALL